jgi:uncharacterized membrane protein YjjP (DUF1212 family)/uncharacterized membrane protein YjjB (DUF3815 family)
MESNDERAELSELIVQLGLAMTMSGESVDAVQEHLYKIAAAKGFTDVELAVMPTSLFVEFGSDARASVRLGVPGGRVPRLDQVTDLYALVGRLERNELSTSEGQQQLDALLAARPRYGRLVRIGGYAVLCAGLSLMLQPSWGGLLAALGLGLLVGALTTWRFVALTMVLPVLASFTVAAIVFLAAKEFDVDNPIRSLIPPLITFLPGAVLTTGTVELAAGQVISGSTRLVQGVVILGMLAFGIVAAAELVGAPPAHLLDQPFDRLGDWAPWVGLLVITLGHHLHNCAPRRTMLPILLVLVVAYVAQSLGALVFGPVTSGFFGALAMTPLVLWMSDQTWGPPSMVTFLPAFWLLVPGAAGLIGATEIVGTDSTLGVNDFSSAINTVFSIALGILIGSALYNSTRIGMTHVATMSTSMRRRLR